MEHIWPVNDNLEVPSDVEGLTPLAKALLTEHLRLTTRMFNGVEKYICLFVVGNQSFRFGPEGIEDKNEASWFCCLFAQALEKLLITEKTEDL